VKGITITALVLSAALILLAPDTTPPAHLNNSIVTKPATSQADEINHVRDINAPNKPQQPSPQTVNKTIEPEKQPTEIKTVAVQEQAPTCESEVRKYDWPQTIAYNVMMAESRNNPGNHNDNLNTGDYSIGCFQINLLGDANLRAKYRDAQAHGYTGDMSVASLEMWFKTASNNVAVAYTMWRSSGWQPWQYTCIHKVVCE
jgi:hypothetical protein